MTKEKHDGKTRKTWTQLVILADDRYDNATDEPPLRSRDEFLSTITVEHAVTTLPITLTATDADGNPLTYAVVALPAHGTLAGTAPNVTYTPTATPDELFKTIPRPITRRIKETRRNPGDNFGCG